MCGFDAHVLDYRRFQRRRPEFRYSDEEWCRIRALLPACDDAQHVHDYYLHTLEAIVYRFLWMTERTDSRSPDVVAAMAAWAKIAEHAKALNAALDEVEAIETQPINSLKFAIATIPPKPKDPGTLLDPYTPRADFKIFRRQIVEAERWATKAAAGLFPKKRGANRSRGEDVDKLIGDMLAFWIDRGGHVGHDKEDKSPSTRFVMAAAGRVLSDTAPDVRLPRAITGFARSRQFNKAARIWTLKA